MTAVDSLVPSVPVDTAVVATSVATYRTTNLGAALIGSELTQYQALKDRGRTKSGTVELALPQARLLAYRLVIPGDTIDLGAQRLGIVQAPDFGVGHPQPRGLDGGKGF